MSCLGDLLLSDDVAILYGGAPHPCHLHIAHHVREGQTKICAMDGHPCASLWGSSHWGHLQDIKKPKSGRNLYMLLVKIDIKRCSSLQLWTHFETINGHRFPWMRRSKYALTVQVAVKAIKSTPTPASKECQNMPWVIVPRACSNHNSSYWNMFCLNMGPHPYTQSHF